MPPGLGQCSRRLRNCSDGACRSCSGSLCPYNPYSLRFTRVSDAAFRASCESHSHLLILGHGRVDRPFLLPSRTVRLRPFPGFLHAWALAPLGLTRAAAKALVQCSALKFAVTQHCRLVQPAPLQPERPSNWQQPLLVPPRSTIPASCFRVSG